MRDIRAMLVELYGEDDVPKLGGVYPEYIRAEGSFDGTLICPLRVTVSEKITIRIDSRIDS